MTTFHNVETRNELADAIMIPRKLLSYILYIEKIESFYETFNIPKKNGNFRQINAPQRKLKSVQQNLAEILASAETNNNISHAFQKNKSFITNAKIHRNKRFILNIDLEDFFDSFHFGRVRGYFLKNKNFLLSNEVATILAQLTCYQGKLPQGAPTSPIITNLICQTLDYRLSKISKKYKLTYTRYADDLTFSTNDKNFLNTFDKFYQTLLNEIQISGFKINENKTRLQFNDSKQEVTGLVVNEKLNVDRRYYKKTRAMAHTLYKTGEFFIDDKLGTLNQLEGRFSFINQIVRYNNNKDNIHRNVRNLSARENDYQKFLFYKYFFANIKPLIVVEGKTDIIYIKSALKKLYKSYPNLISKNEDGTFDYKISFLNKTKRLRYFLDVNLDGGSVMNKIFQFYERNKGKLNFSKYFIDLTKNKASNPVILIFDNETKTKKKPLKEFLNKDSVKSLLTEETLLEEQPKYMNNLVDNLYLITTPLVKNLIETEIEDLFSDETLNHKINGKTINRESQYNTDEHYGKEIFSRYIMNNYESIDFSDFISFLDNINYIVSSYPKKPNNSL